MTARGDLAALTERLGHAFSDPELLVRALTHASVQGGGETYQRLEFLGDRVLGLVVADALFRMYPKADEGELSPRFTRLVRRETCAEVAREADLGRHIRLGPGESTSGGRTKDAILADVCEAVMGALYVDGGLEAARGFIERYWGDRLAQKVERLKDAKTALQEWAHSQGHQRTPAYREVERAGPDHAPVFTVEVQVEGVRPATGQGSSKRIAEQSAAEAMLVRERVWKGAKP
ncbi:ribonuclease III [Lutibaculum baratangense]|nr:ribonuclease III [Lutibaculum baratangense]